MANLATARTRLGLWGHATRLVGSFLRAPPAVVTTAFATALDAVVTLSAALNGTVTNFVALDAVVTLLSPSNARVTSFVALDTAVIGAAASDTG
mgnify:CR=1 FL=1